MANRKSALGVAFAIAGVGCALTPVSTTTPPSDANILFWQDEVQSEPDMAVAEMPGHVQTAITQYNDFSIGMVNGTVEWSPGASGRIVNKGYSLMGWAITTDGKTWSYRGKVRPPPGWWAIVGDPTTAVDDAHPFAAYMVQMGMSEAAYNALNPPPPSPDQTVQKRDGFCVGRSLDAGHMFGAGDAGQVFVPRMSACHRVTPVEGLVSAQGIDQIAATVDWHGRLWVATEDRDQDRVRLFRNRNATYAWDTFDEIPVCSGISGNPECIPAAAIGNRRPILRSTIPCSDSHSDDCVNAPNGHQGVFLMSTRMVAGVETFLLAEFSATPEPLACSSGSECLTGTCSTFGACQCTADTDCPVFAPTCVDGLCSGAANLSQCVTDLNCVARECARGGRCACQSNSDCRASQMCLDGACSRKACTDDTQCPAGWRCPGPSDPEVQFNGVAANLCTQRPSWAYVNLTQLCGIGTLLPDSSLGPLVLGAGLDAALFRQAFNAWFDIGYTDAGLPAVRLAYVYDATLGGEYRAHIQLAQVLLGGAVDVCLPMQNTQQRVVLPSSPKHQQFWPTIDWHDRSVFDGLAADALRLGWQTTFLSTHNVVNVNQRYVQPYGSTLNDFGMFTLVPLVPGQNFFGESDNYVCANLDPGSGPPSPPGAYWGDYFRTSQMMVPAIGTGVLGMPGWLNVTAFPHSAPRPVGQPSPCFVEENITSDPQHVSAIAWPQFRLF